MDQVDVGSLRSHDCRRGVLQLCVWLALRWRRFNLFGPSDTQAAALQLGAFSSMYIQYIRRPGISQVSFFQGWHVDDACRILSPGPFRHTFLHTICIYINMLRCVGGRVKDFQKISPHKEKGYM